MSGQAVRGDLLAIFNQFSKDGRVDVNHIIHFLQAVSKDKNTHSHKHEYFWVAAKNYLTDNRNSPTMTQKQFLEYFSRPTRNNQQFDHLFNTIDTDFSGQISASELIKWGQYSFSNGINEKTAKQLIEYCSQNGQQTVTNKQLYQFLYFK